jgi:hypothetical protein
VSCIHQTKISRTITTTKAIINVIKTTFAFVNVDVPIDLVTTSKVGFFQMEEMNRVFKNFTWFELGRKEGCNQKIGGR